MDDFGKGGVDGFAVFPWVGDGVDGFVAGVSDFMEFAVYLPAWFVKIMGEIGELK